jgi:hypothetical protein
MKDTLDNKLSSFTATLDVADQADFQPVWHGQPPAAFAVGLTAVRAQVTTLRTKAAKQSAPPAGNAEALKTLRKNFEKKLHVLARATYQALKRLNRPEDAEQANLTPSDFSHARANNLAGLGETILDLAEPLTTAPAGGGDAPGVAYGVTADRVAAVNTLWENYSTAIGAPRGARAERKALTDALPDDFRTVEAAFAALDDLVVQFPDADEPHPQAQEFMDAWFNARKVVDLGRRAAKPNPPTPPPNA